MNQELYDPCERAFAGDWQRVMDATCRTLLAKAKTDVLTVCERLKTDLAKTLIEAGIEPARLATMMTAAVRGSTTNLNGAFSQMTPAGHRRLILTRHAKSSWDDPTITDHDRPLNGRGRRAALELGELGFQEPEMGHGRFVLLRARHLLAHTHTVA